MHYGVREHGMAAAMNGIALHGGLIPYGGTFLCFSDYCRPSIRLAALMQIRTIFVMTHDSIGLGEDGPTHQPVEHLAALRAIPHLAVYRPGDPVETAECWELILDAPRRAALIALSRQPMPLLRREPGTENQSRQGRLCPAGGRGRRAQAHASWHGVGTASRGRGAGRYCRRRASRRRSFRCPAAVLRGAGRRLQEGRARRDPSARRGGSGGGDVGWERYLGFEGRFVGMHGFGASGKIGDVYKKFDITTEAVVRAAKDVVREVEG